MNAKFFRQDEQDLQDNNFDENGLKGQCNLAQGNALGKR
jgi:hypothetical protein